MQNTRLGIVFRTFLFQFAPIGLVSENVFQLQFPHVIDK